MQLLTDVKVTSYSSWHRDGDSRSHLTLIMGAQSATLVYKSSFGEDAVVTLSTGETHALGADLLKLVPTAGRVIPYKDRAGATTNRVDPESGLTISIVSNTDGEPYREGVRFEITQADNYTDVISMDFESYEAHRLATDLRAGV